MAQFEAPPNTAERQHPNPLLKLALELGPLGVFFFANARGEWLAEKIPALASLGDSIFIATALFIVATLISLAISLAVTRRLPIMPFVTGIVVVFFGGLTLLLQDDTFIKMKPTIVNTLFGGVLLGGLFFGRSFIGYVLDSVFQMSDEGWRKLTLRWGLFFIALAILNEIVWRSAHLFVDGSLPPGELEQAATDLWVSFKVFGIMPLTLIFTAFQLPLIMREQAKMDAQAATPAE